MGESTVTTRRARKLGLTTAIVLAALLAACAPTTTVTPGVYPTKATLDYVKRTTYGQRAQSDSALIGSGLQQPILDFTVEDTPPSIFVNYIVPDAQAAAFNAVAPLPPGFTLAKMKILESDPVARYWLSLNVYRVSGLTTGLRAEWSTYVDDGSGVPRFMILKARASEGSLDPLGPLALPEPFIHDVTPGPVITTAMNATVIQDGTPVVTGNNLFNSTIRLPAPADRNYVVPTAEWVGGNDFIYWLNGVNDRTFHNSTSHSAPLISIDPADVTLDDATAWAPYIDPTPGHVLVYLDKLQFMISPWWNVTEADGRVAPGTRASLLELKNTIYGGLSNITALGVLAGTSEPVVQTTSDGAPPLVSWHWRIPAGQLAAFQSAIDVPAGQALSPVLLQEGDAQPEYWLTLTVDQVSGSSSGSRGEWTTYVTDGTKVRTLILESRSGFSSLDPINLSTIPYPVTHSISSGTVTSSVGTGPTSFSSTFAVPPAGPGNAAIPARQFVGAGDLRYWQNGVADRVFAESTVLTAKISVDPATVSLTDGSRWAQFVSATPDRVWVDQVSVDRVTNPWWNLNGL